MLGEGGLKWPSAVLTEFITSVDYEEIWGGIRKVKNR